MADAIKFLTLDVWGKNEEWLRDYINKEDAKSIKTVALSSDNEKFLFYKELNPTADTIPAFEITIPAADLSTVIKKVTGAVEGDVAIFSTGGSLKDTGLKAEDLATRTTVEGIVAEKISQAAHMKKVVVQELPAPEDADANTFYLIKIESSTGKDKYEIWTKIGEELILIDDTSLNLSGYLTSEQVKDFIATAKQEAINSAVATADLNAQAKADKALADAKSYTDSLVDPLKNRVSTLEGRADNIDQSIITINQNMSSLGDRINTLETTVGNMQVATVEEALSVFQSVFGS